MNTPKTNIDVDAEKLADNFILAHKQILAESVSAKTVIDIVPLIMEIVEKAGPRSGADKKELAIKVINKILDKTTIAGPIDPAIDALAKIAVPHIIELVIQAADGVFNVQALRSFIKRLTMCCKGGRGAAPLQPPPHAPPTATTEHK